MITYIAVKEISKRCPRKNHILLPYVLNQVKDYLDIVVITDSEELINVCKQYNIEYYIDNSNIDEMTAIYNYLSNQNKLDSDEEFLMLPVTQPFRNKETILNVINSDLTNYDIVTTYSWISNRNIFLLNSDNNFKVDSFNRKGSMCSKEKMADGAIYKMRNSFIKKIVESSDTNHEFWSSKIKFIENTSDIILDIDTLKDLNVFNIITNNDKTNVD